MFYPMRGYTLRGFEKAKQRNKKYNAILSSNKTGKIYTVPFGDSRMEQYEDKTGLGIYAMKNHKDPERRKLYRLRHSKDIKTGFYSPGYFSWNYLW